MKADTKVGRTRATLGMLTISIVVVLTRHPHARCPFGRGRRPFRRRRCRVGHAVPSLQPAAGPDRGFQVLHVLRRPHRI